MTRCPTRFEFCGVSARAHARFRRKSPTPRPLRAPAGRGKQSHAYIHSVQQDHHVFINLETGKVRMRPLILPRRADSSCLICFLSSRVCFSSADVLWSSLMSSHSQYQCFLQYESCRFIACLMDTRLLMRRSKIFRYCDSADRFCTLPPYVHPDIESQFYFHHILCAMKLDYSFRSPFSL
jgi:hypothetical protein